MSRLRVAVLMGGRSSEHDISVASASSVIEALRDRYDTVSVEIDREGRWALPAAVPPALEAAEHTSEPLEALPIPAESSVPATLAAATLAVAGVFAYLAWRQRVGYGPGPGAPSEPTDEGDGGGEAPAGSGDSSAPASSSAPPA